MVPIVCLIPKKEKVRRAVRHRPRCVPRVGREIFRRGASSLAQDDNGNGRAIVKPLLRKGHIKSA